MFLLFVLFVMGVLVGVGGVVVDVVLGPNQFCCDKFFDN